MTSTYGEVSYNDDSTEKKQGPAKDSWLRLEPGDNEVRLLTNPFQYSVHKIKKDPKNPKDFGQKVYCSLAHGSCPACEMGDKPKTRWMYGVINRKTGTYKVLDVPYLIFSNIKKLAKNVARWGDPQKYDLNIVMDPSGGSNGFYSVQPLPKEPLSAADQQIKDNVDFDDLKSRVTPPTPESVQKRLDKILASEPMAPAAVAAANSVKKSSKAAPQPVTLDDDDEFPDYDAQ